MIDTIRVKFPISPTLEQLKGWIRKTTSSPTGTSDMYIYNTIENDAMLKFTYRPLDFKGNPILSLEVSLPKLSFGYNYQMIGNIEEVVKVVNSRLGEIPYLPKLDIAEGVLIRLDMCYNYQVGEAVDDYITAIGNLDYPHRRTKYHKYEGTEFRAKHKTTKFYNKERESGYSEARGILRHEITLLRPKDIQKFLHNPKPTLLNVTRELVVEELQNDLARLGLLNNSIANRDTAFELLCETHGELAGLYYWGLLMNKTKKSRKRIKNDAKMHPRSIDRKLRKILDTGIPLTITDREEPLPPLVIDL